jgi:hypothetical protein
MFAPVDGRSTTAQDICFALYQIRLKNLSPDPEIVAREAGCKAIEAYEYLKQDPTLRAIAYSIRNHTGSVLAV